MEPPFPTDMSPEPIPRPPGAEQPPNQAVRRCARLFLTVLAFAAATVGAAYTLGTLSRLRLHLAVDDWALPEYLWALAPYAVLVLVSAWASKRVASASVALLGALAVAALGFVVYHVGYKFITTVYVSYLLPGVLLGVCGLITGIAWLSRFVITEKGIAPSKPGKGG